MIGIFILIIIIIIYYMTRNKNPYDVAYDLGIQYLESVGYSPNYIVMFDIDDTLIKNDYKPIKQIIKLLGECNQRSIKVLILTARDSKYTDETISELMEAGIYPNIFNRPKKSYYYDYIYLRNSPEDDHNLFKSMIKENYAKNGLFTIMSVGDNVIDVVGDYSGYTLKLPNISDPRLFHKNNFGQIVHVKTN